MSRGVEGVMATFIRIACATTGSRSPGDECAAQDPDGDSGRA